MLTWAGDPGKQIPIVEGGVVPSAAQTVAYSFSVAGTREKPISPKIKEYPLLYPNNGASSLSRVNGRGWSQSLLPHGLLPLCLTQSLEDERTKVIAPRVARILPSNSRFLRASVFSLPTALLEWFLFSFTLLKTC